MSKEVELNILVVEDDIQLLEQLTDLLTAEGYRVWPISLPKEALKIARGIMFPCVLTELHLPRVSGIDLMNEVRKIDFRTSCVTMTAIYDAAIDSVKKGAYDYIIKPVKPDEVKIKIYRAIERYFLLYEVDKKKYYYELSNVDGLTGVYNHRYLDEVFENEIRRAKYLPNTFSTLMIDIDDFKKYNDTLGHQAGDDLLKGLGRFFTHTIRPTDMVFRYGGEEFVLLLDSTDKQEAKDIAEQLLSLVRKRLQVTLSIGISTYPVDAKEKDRLIEKADKALYHAKSTGKDRICLYAEDTR
ncbi:MAG: diguanylate cyclase [Candidatus Omnitrophota bacterium]